ncbi:hypothetical protein BDW62DRAFT_168315 [Aspergillus aurantiobrunneus]
MSKHKSPTPDIGYEEYNRQDKGNFPEPISSELRPTKSWYCEQPGLADIYLYDKRLIWLLSNTPIWQSIVKYANYALCICSWKNHGVERQNVSLGVTPSWSALILPYFLISSDSRTVEQQHNQHRISRLISCLCLSTIKFLPTTQAPAHQTIPEPSHDSASLSTTTTNALADRKPPSSLIADSQCSGRGG